MRHVFVDYADTGKVCVIYRSYPNFAYSREAARFAQAALRIGAKEWVAVADALFEKQPEWSVTGKVAAVAAGALNANDLVTAQKYLDDPKLEGGIDDDIISGSDRKVRSTPTFFITAKGKTEKVEAALTYPAMQRRLEELLK
jgi:protein-disulfide isomerase